MIALSLMLLIMPAGLEPWSGSIRPKQTHHLTGRQFGEEYLRFCSSPP